ncbi:uncharacterized protein LOC122261032 [Penaeus japonicus]|uniref:uncharacterized protein LOC122261032 n=1 Tax=Penaeus japonicus TaxID=27405 RepID=UPI001C713709|nr:uncharacterized protein LOC122261032 [Penaeus japonicus]
MSPVKVSLRRVSLLMAGALLLVMLFLTVDESVIGDVLGFSEDDQIDEIPEGDYYETGEGDAVGEIDFDDDAAREAQDQDRVAEGETAEGGAPGNTAGEEPGKEEATDAKPTAVVVKNEFPRAANYEPEVKKPFAMERFGGGAPPRRERVQPFGQWQAAPRGRSGFGGSFSPKKETPCTVPALKSIPQFIHQVSDLEAKCNELRTFGTAPRGKDLCLDDKYKIKPGSCFVFSFGINFDWSFEDDMGKFGCMVYAYDPTMGKADHQRSENIHFYATGISNYKGTKLLRLNNRVFMSRVDRFVNFLKAAGMEGEEIDVIKLDAEMSQVDFLQDLLFNSRHLLKKIKQIAMTVYTDVVEKNLNQGGFFQLLWPYLQMMKCAGFKVISSNRSRRGREVVWAQDKEW